MGTTSIRIRLFSRDFTKISSLNSRRKLSSPTNLVLEKPETKFQLVKLKKKEARMGNRVNTRRPMSIGLIKA
ncbi:hypothetical protein D3C81_2028170 [compost metagenome]